MFNRLSLRLALPVVTGVLLWWGALALFVPGMISRYAGEQAGRGLAARGREAASILDESRERLAQSAKPADPGEVRKAKARALAGLEKHFRLTNTPVLVTDASGETLLRLDQDGPGLLDRLPREPGRLTHAAVDGADGYALQTEFPAWGWRVLMVDGDDSLASLAAKVRALILGAGMFLALGLGAFLLLTRRTVSRPLALINHALGRGQRPEYRGVEEFAALARSIRGVMAALDEREHQLRIGRTWYKRMFESAPVMMFSLARSGWFTDVNSALCSLSGHTRKQLLAAPASEILEVDPGRMRELWAGAPQSRVPARIRAPEGRIRDVLLDAVLTEEPSGERVVLAVAVDVTDQLRTERELIAAKEAAEAASQAKSEFLANVSHEIRTPLNGVLGMLQLLEKSPHDPRQGGWVRIALDCGRSLMNLLGDILDYSSLEACGLKTCREPFAPAEILAEIAQLYARQAADKGIGLAVSADESLPRTLLGDGGRLRQVLFNLAGNAVKFTETGQVTLRVEGLGNAARGPSRLLVSVEDTGIGIAADKLGHIFEPFTQADGSHTRRHQGAGLGLALVKRLVALVGGALEIESEPGTGTAVRFTMPVGPAPAGAEAPLPAPVHPAETHAGGRVLLAEDDPVNTVMTMDMLESLGYRATIVENGAEAVKALAQEDFDCLLMDIQMPEMDGITATKAIRHAPALGEKSAVPIVALTAHALPGDRERFLAAGMDDYLSKPVEYDDLAGALARAMGKAWRRRLS